MCTWEEIGHKWNRAQQMGWQAIQAAMEVGEELQQKKLETPHGEFLRRAGDIGFTMQRTNELMRLALHRDLIEEHKPDSMRGALALLPKVPTKTGEKQIEVHKAEVDKYGEFAKATAKKQAEVLAKKIVRVELDRLQNDAHESVTTELKAVKKQLDKERKRIAELMEDADKKQQFYQDLVNKRMNGFDWKAGMRDLKQAIHPDRPETSERVKARAMVVVQQLEKFLHL